MNHLNTISIQCHYGNTNCIVTKHKGHTGEYWASVAAVRTNCSKVHTASTEGKYSPVWLEKATVGYSVYYNYDTQFLIILVGNFEFAGFAPKQNTQLGNSPHCKILTEKEPIRLLDLPLNTSHSMV